MSFIGVTSPNLGSKSNLFTMTALVALIVIGIILVVKVFSKRECPEQKIRYIFIPRTFKEQQQSPAPLNDVFGNMFSDASIVPA
mgnify:CR=1 FL=1